MTKKLLLLCSLLQFSLGFSQQTSITENTKVSILTVGLADDVSSIYGHTAIRIQDSRSGIDLVYNYGMFDFRTENFVLKFVKGDLQYYAGAYPYSDFEYSYQVANRSIYEQTLDISLAEKQQLFEKLNTSIFTQERFYTYKFIDRNCTTKVIDIVNSVLEKKPIVKKNIDDKTYRDVLYSYTEKQFYQRLGINIIFGEKVDQQETKIFLPLDLLENLKNISYKNKPLAAEMKVLYEASKKETHFSFFDSIYSLIILLLVVVILNKKVITVIYFSILGIVGLLFFIVTFYSFHKEVLWNYNMLLFNPIYLVLVYFIIRNNEKWTKKIVISVLIALGLYTVYMLNKIHLLIVTPMILASAILLLRLYLKKTTVLYKTK
jgi:Domain of unknown function (DUF4105)